MYTHHSISARPAQTEKRRIHNKANTKQHVVGQAL